METYIISCCRGYRPEVSVGLLVKGQPVDDVAVLQGHEYLPAVVHLKVVVEKVIVVEVIVVVVVAVVGVVILEDDPLPRDDVVEQVWVEQVLLEVGPRLQRCVHELPHVLLEIRVLQLRHLYSEINIKS